MSWLTKKKNSKPSLTNSTKHLLKCPVTKPSFPPSYSLNISFKTTPKKTTNPTTKFFFVFLWKKTVPYFSAWLVGHLIQSTPPMTFLYFQKYMRRKVIFCDTQPLHFRTKKSSYPSYCHSHYSFSHGSYYFAPKNCSKFKLLLREEFWFSKKKKKSLKEERNFTWN